MLVDPNTNPRGAEMESKEDAYDLGCGADFYITTTTEKWTTYYHI